MGGGLRARMLALDGIERPRYRIVLVPDDMSTIDASVHTGAVPVTKSDATNDPNAGPSGSFSGLFVFVAGNLSFIDGKGQPVGTTGAPLAVQYGYIPIRCQRVNATGTTAVVYGLQASP